MAVIGVGRFVCLCFVLHLTRADILDTLFGKKKINIENVIEGLQYLTSEYYI
jgi:hypothetical protein